MDSKDIAKAEAARHGLFYPPAPSSDAFSSIGGNAACDAGGLQCVKYGTTKHYVLGVEAVLPSGEIIRTGGKCVKNVAGYDLPHLLVGSEGTQVKFAEMAAADTCCGCGGTFSLTRYELARRINDAKVASIEATGAATLVTGCPACRMHTNDGLSRRQGSVRVLHTAQFVAVANAD